MRAAALPALRRPAATEGIKAYQAYRQDESSELSRAREALQKMMFPLPRTWTETDELVTNVAFLESAYRGPTAQAFVRKTLDDLRDRSLRLRQKSEVDAMAERSTAELARLKRGDPIGARQFQQGMPAPAASGPDLRTEPDPAQVAEQQARLDEAARRATEIAAQTARQDEAIRARMFAKAIDRAPL